MLVRFRYLLCFFIVFTVFQSCNQSQKVTFTPDPEVISDLDEIVARGYINALVDNNSVSYFIYKGQPMGYEYELLNLFAEHLGVDLKIKVTSGVDRAIDQGGALRHDAPNRDGRRGDHVGPRSPRPWRP